MDSGRQIYTWTPSPTEIWNVNANIVESVGTTQAPRSKFRWNQTATTDSISTPVIRHAVFSGDGSVFLTCDSRNYMQLRSSTDGTAIGPVVYFYNGELIRLPDWAAGFTDQGDRVHVSGIHLNYDGTVVCITGRGDYQVLRTCLSLDREAPTRDSYDLLATLAVAKRERLFNKAILSPNGSLVVQVFSEPFDDVRRHRSDSVNRIGIWMRTDSAMTLMQDHSCSPGGRFHESIAISHNCDLVAAFDTSGVLYLFTIKPTATERHDLYTPTSSPDKLWAESMMAFSPNGKELAWVANKVLYIWSLASLQLVGSCSLGDDVSDGAMQFRYCPNGKYTCLLWSKKALIIEMLSLTIIRVIDMPDQRPNHGDTYFGINSILRLHYDKGTIGCESLPFSVFHDMSFSGETQQLSRSSRILTGQLEIPDHATGGGGFGEIYRASWRNKEKCILPIPEVAVKVMRAGSFSAQQSASVKRILEREIALWQMLQHDNILPFLGITYDLGQLPSMVSEWMSNGTVLEFLQAHPKVNRLEIITGTAHGLEFLHAHQPHVIHGDMKAANVLIDFRGNSRITDFGISKVLDPGTFWKITTKTDAAGSVPWMSPELLSGDIPQVTVSSDVYAFAMTSLEIMTGKTPWSTKYSHPGQVITAVCLRQERPQRPDSEMVTDALWSSWQLCWSVGVDSRPTMTQTYSTLRSMAVNYRPLRILSIDHSFSRIGSLFVYLRHIFRHMPFGTPVHQYFDLIGGSMFGGFVAILLGRMHLDIDQCLEEINALCIVLWKLSMAGKPGKVTVDLFAQAVVFDGEVGSHVKDMIIRHGHKPEDRFTDFDHNSARVIVYSASNRHLPHPRRSYTTGWEDPYPSSLHAVLMDCIEASYLVTLTSPSQLILDEARVIYGTQRKIGCFVSCGHAQTASSLNPPDTSKVYRLRYTLRRQQEVEEVHHILANELGASYFRLDFKEYVEQVVESEIWVGVLGFADWSTFATVKSLAAKYMAQPRQTEEALSIARALQWQTKKEAAND